MPTQVVPSMHIDQLPVNPHDIAYSCESDRAKIPAKTFYVASRTSRAGFWLGMQRSVPRMRASWIFEAGPGMTKDKSELWTRIQREVESSYALFLYVAYGDMPLKGAFVEVGMALAKGIPVYVFPQSMASMDIEKYIGSWINHPLVTILDPNMTLVEAIQIVDRASLVPA